MITQGDIARILYTDCQVFDIDVYQRENTPKGKISKERIVIAPKKGAIDTYWERCYVEVNFCVPDIGGQADLIRMDELERMAAEIFRYSIGVYDGSVYRYKKESTSREEDVELGCHYVNVRLLFEILNV